MASSQDEEEEFAVSEILSHGKFEDLLERTVLSKCSLNPNDLESNSVHPKYAFLVHWRTYSVEERTWEPESYLKDVGILASYKQKNQLESEYVEFRKNFDAHFCRRVKLGAENLSGVKHLLTKEEWRESKKIGLEQWLRMKNEANRKQWEEEDARKAAAEIRKRERSAEEKEEARRKRKAEKRKEQAATEDESRKKFKIPKTDRGDKPRPEDVPGCSSSSSKSSIKPQSLLCSNGDTDRNESMMKLKRPGVHSLDEKTPKIQKKSRANTDETPKAVQATSSICGPHPRVEKTSSVEILNPQPLQEHRRGTSSDCSSRNNAPKETVPVKHSMEVFKPTDIQKNYKSAKTPAAAIQSNAPIPDVSVPSVEVIHPEKNLPQMSVPKRVNREETPEEKELKEIEEKLRMFKKQEESYLKERKKFQMRYEAVSAHRTFPHVLEQRKLRRWKSSEELVNRFDKNATIELISTNYEMARGLEGPNELPVKKTRPVFQPMNIRTLRVLTEEDRIQNHRNRLFERNWQRVKHRMEEKGLRQKEFQEAVMLLVKAYTFDDPNLFCQLVELNFASSSEVNLDVHRFTAFVLIICICDHPYWKADPDGFTIVESDNRRRICNGIIREQEIRCSEGHRKCIWMDRFLKLMPERYRFEETSGRAFNGLDGESDGPFRDDVFHHCMVYGAECQKSIFFRFNKPLGLCEDPDGWDYQVDAIHLLAVQHGNVQRIPYYITEAGFDVNAFASNIRTNRVLRLHDYVKEWTKVHVPAEQTELVEYYKQVYEVIRFTADALEMFVEMKANQMIFECLAGRWKCYADLTLPHIIRCSPASNNSLSSYEGTHQTLTNLFYPLNHCGLRDGLDALDEEGLEELDVEILEELEASRRRFQKWVRDKTVDGKQKGRLVLCLFRIQMDFDAVANENQPYAIPKIRHVASDDGIKIARASILRQRPGLTADVSDIQLIEIPGLQSPGAHFYGVPTQEIEESLVVPGNAHLELKAVVTEPMTFAVQVFFIKKTVA